MLNSNFKDMLTALNDAEAEYLIIGAYAMAAHGCPRATGDIDIWIRPTPDNAAKVWDALRRFGAPLSRVTVADLHTPETVYQIGLPPQRIDILTSVSGVDFEAAWMERLPIDVEGLAVSVIGLRHLYENKLACGREKDVLDAKILKKLIGE
jgi:hypothetical protein